MYTILDVCLEMSQPYGITDKSLGIKKKLNRPKLISYLVIKIES